MLHPLIGTFAAALTIGMPLIIIAFLTILFTAMMLPRERHQEFIRNLERDIQVYINRLGHPVRVEDSSRMDVMPGPETLRDSSVTRAGSVDDRVRSLVTELRDILDSIDELARDVHFMGRHLGTMARYREDMESWLTQSNLDDGAQEADTSTGEIV
jgi:hypothetical protein